MGITLTLPFGCWFFKTLHKDGAAMTLALLIGGICGGVSLVVVLGLVKPGLLVWIIKTFGGFLPNQVKGKVEFTNAVGAYQGKPNCSC